MTEDKISKIIEIVGFEEDCLWNEGLNELFNDISIENFADIFKNRDAVITEKLRNTSACQYDFKPSIENLIKDGVVEIIDEARIRVLEPAVFKEGFHLPGLNISLGAYPIFLGQFSTLTQTSIYSPTFICQGAEIEHSSFQSEDRCTLIGPYVKISNVGEIRGCFISGGPLRSEGRERTYIHADSLNNVIAGNYSGISDGTDVYNHPVRGDSRIIDPHTKESIQTTFRKLPILIGVRTTVGAQCLLNSGSIIGADCVVPSRTEVDGLFYLTGEGKQECIKAKRF